MTMFFKNCNTKYEIKNTLFLALIICSINIIQSNLFNQIIEYYNISYKPNPIPFNNLFEEFFLVVLFAPLFETIIFQVLPEYYLRNFNIKITIIISSLFFGLSHWYTVLNFIYGLSVGFLFILGYIRAKKSKLNPIVTIFFAHLFYNFYAFLII